MPPKRRVEAIEEEEDGVKLVSLHDPEEDEKAEEVTKKTQKEKIKETVNHSEEVARILKAERLWFLKQQEAEEKAHYKEELDDAITKLWENIYSPDQDVYWEVLIGKLLVLFAREVRCKRPEKPDFLNLDKLEALRTKHLEASGHEPWGLVGRIEWLEGQEVFESYLKLLTETRAHFGHGFEYMVMQYIKAHEGDAYYLNLCMSCYNEK